MEETFERFIRNGLAMQDGAAWHSIKQKLQQVSD